MISLDTRGSILCLLVVRYYLYIRVLLPWFTLSSLHLFMCFVMTLVESFLSRLWFSYPGAHAQNGVAEHKHRHLLETAPPLMVTASLSPHFCAESVCTSIYLINLPQSIALQGGAPFECLFDYFLIIRHFETKI